MALPFESLEYVYLGSRDFKRDLAYYRDVLGGEVMWNLEGFGAHVAAVRLGRGPLLPPPGPRPPPRTRSISPRSGISGGRRKPSAVADGKPRAAPSRSRTGRASSSRTRAGTGSESSRR